MGYLIFACHFLAQLDFLAQLESDGSFAENDMQK